MKLATVFNMGILMIVLAFLLGGCQDSGSGSLQEPQDPETDIHVYKAPLYWSVYEYCWNQSKNIALCSGT